MGKSMKSTDVDSAIVDAAEGASAGPFRTSASAPSKPRRMLINGDEIGGARGEPWSWVDDGYVVTGSFTGAKHVNTTYEGAARKRTVVDLMVDGEHRAVFLPESYLLGLRKLSARKRPAITIEREDRERDNGDTFPVYHVYLAD